MSERAPLFEDIADGPKGGQAVWLTATDGVRIRVAHWAAARPMGTIILFPGRTEYIEKYGRNAKDFVARGYSVLTIDWRGQGLADRPVHNRLQGHVTSFRDYQLDVAALVSHARDVALPKPYYLIGHSMGACIGLRSLHEGLPVGAVVFTGPMWGITISRFVRPFAWALAKLSRRMNRGHSFPPGQSEVTYLRKCTFEDNTLTTNREMFDYMCDQIATHPELELGGPSQEWLHEALVETRALNRMPSPKTPCLTYLGTDETIVDAARVRSRMKRWPNGRLLEMQGLRHEILMEDVTTRGKVIDQIVTFFADPR